MAARYDIIGVDYAQLRTPDPRIAALIHVALGNARNILNVGAGTGSYEPADRAVTALEPSAAMIRQRPETAAPAIQGRAEDLPFADKSFDAAMAILTVHHWEDQAKGFAEMRRVTRGPIVILTIDPDFRGAWLNDYVPALVTLDAAIMPRMADYADWLGPVDIAPVPIPHDCTDGFLYAYWRRPHAYLDPRVRQGISSFHFIDGIEACMARLACDLDSGDWARRHADLLDRESCDMGYRLITTR
jgi:SAM-dependent methyltransferase